MSPEVIAGIVVAVIGAAKPVLEVAVNATETKKDNKVFNVFYKVFAPIEKLLSVYIPIPDITKQGRDRSVKDFLTRAVGKAKRTDSKDLKLKAIGELKKFFEK